MKRVISLLLLAAVAVTALSACKPNPPTKDTLAAPTVTINGSVANWNAIPNANGYDVYFNGSFGQYVTDTHITLYFTVATEIQVVAKGDGELYADSPKSVAVTFTPSNGSHDTEETKLTQIDLLPDGANSYLGKLDDDIAFVEEEFLLKDYWWEQLEAVFSDYRDNDGGYRSEFWGKMVRGACYSYQYTGNQAVYDKVEASVKRVMELQKQQGGKLSGFDEQHEFDGWDLQARGYSLKGYKEFYITCKDPELREQVKQGLLDQVDYIMSKVGAGDDQVDILYTSPDWGGCNSCNILEGVVFAYTLSQDTKYRDYAKYIIDRGGSAMISSQGKTIVQSALDHDPMYTFGCRKIYEVTNFMEGVLQYYLATGDRQALRIAEGYYYSASSCEITEVGGLGVDVEEAGNSAVEQCDPTNLGRMQETCVGTAWLKFCVHLYQITGDSSIIDNVERELYNFAYGIMDYEKHYDYTFFSYSPLHTMARADIYSGTAYLDPEGKYCQSCCVMSGISLLPYVAKTGITARSNGYDVNLYLAGTTTTQTENGNDIRFTCETNYPVDGEIKYTVNMGRPERFAVRFRIPAWSKTAVVKLNGVEQTGVVSGDWFTLNRTWKDGDTVELSFDMRAYLINGSEECSNPNGKYNVVVKRGPLVFARDYRLEGEGMFDPLQFALDDNDELTVELVQEPTFKSQLQLKVKLANGEFVTLVDYGSAGKTMDDDSIMCLWIPTVDYWSADLNESVVVRTATDKELLTFDESNGTLIVEHRFVSDTDTELLRKYSWTFEEQPNGKYKIKLNNTQDYLTVNGSLLTHAADNGQETQLFTLKRCGMSKYQIVTVDGLVLSHYTGGSLFPLGSIYCEYNIAHPDQYWIITNL